MERKGNGKLLIFCHLFHIQNINKKIYGCTEAFLADAKWILHNCIIFNGSKFPLYVLGWCEYTINTCIPNIMYV